MKMKEKAAPLYRPCYEVLPGVRMGLGQISRMG